MAKQVFYDPLQARWRRIRRFVDAAAIAFSLLVVFFIYSALRSEPLPDLSWLTEKRPYHALKEDEKTKAREKRRLATLARIGHRHQVRKAPSQLTLNSVQGVRAAFYVSWDAASFSSLREYARQIDLLFPTWLQVLSPDGHLEAVDPETNAMFDVIHGNTVHPVDTRVMPFLRAEDTEMEVFPVVQNFDGTDFVPGIVNFLNSPQAHANFRREIGLFLATDHYRGLMIDFESFPKEGQSGYVTLLNELASDLHAKGMKLYVSVQVRNEDFDYKAISAAVDGVVIMNYDEHFPGGTAGPVASLILRSRRFRKRSSSAPSAITATTGSSDRKKASSHQERPTRAYRCRKPGSERAMPKRTLTLTATRSTPTSAMKTTITSATMSGSWMR
jgi:hypothetical protein